MCFAKAGVHYVPIFFSLNNLLVVQAFLALFVPRPLVTDEGLLENKRLLSVISEIEFYSHCVACRTMCADRLAHSRCYPLHSNSMYVGRENAFLRPYYCSLRAS